MPNPCGGDMISSSGLALGLSWLVRICCSGVQTPSHLNPELVVLSIIDTPALCVHAVVPVQTSACHSRPVPRLLSWPVRSANVVIATGWVCVVLVPA